jgi:hypothetical protein
MTSEYLGNQVVCLEYVEDHALFTAQHVSGVFPPIIRSSMTAVKNSGFTFVSR